MLIDKFENKRYDVIERCKTPYYSRGENHMSMKKSISTLVIVAMLLSSLFCLLAIIPAAAEEGTPVSITTAEEFAAMTSGNYVLGADLTLPAATGAVIAEFTGTLDGNGHKITLSSGPVFGTLKDATVKNLTVVGENLTAGIAASGKGTVKFDKVSVNIKEIKPSDAANYAAGFIGYMYGEATFTSCQMGVAPTADAVANTVIGIGYAAGGFIGEAVGVINISDSANYANIHIQGNNGGKGSSAGIVGIFADAAYNNDAGEKISANKFNAVNVRNYGKITGDGNWHEGISGFIGNAKWQKDTEMTFKNCGNHGDISDGNNNKGGFIGHCGTSKLVTFENCINTGDISGMGNNSGFIGQVGVHGTRSFTDCVNAGNITSTNSQAGGFESWQYDTGVAVTYTRCYNFGDINSQRKNDAGEPDGHAGGFVTYNPNATYTFIDCANFGTVEGTKVSSGFVVQSKSASLTNCISGGAVTGGGLIDDYVAAISTDGEKTITDCTVTSKDRFTAKSRKDLETALTNAGSAEVIKTAVEAITAAKNALVDFSELNESYNKNKDLDLTGVNEQPLAAFNTALANAKAIIDDANDETKDVTAAAVAEALAALTKAKDGLADTEALENAINEAQALDSKSYTAESFAALQAAIKKAKEDKEVATTAPAVNAAIAALNAVKDSLVDITELNEVLATAAMLSKNDYSKETWDVLVAALRTATSVKKNGTVEEVAAAKETLASAISALKAPGSEEKPSEQPSEAPTSAPTEKPTEKTTEPAASGGCKGAVGFAAIAIASVLGIGLVAKRKEN